MSVLSHVTITWKSCDMHIPRVLDVRGRAEVSISNMTQLAMMRVRGVLCGEGRR